MKDFGICIIFLSLILKEIILIISSGKAPCEIVVPKGETRRSLLLM